MAKAEIVTPDGTKITLNGTAREISAVLDEIKVRQPIARQGVRKQVSTPEKVTIPGLIEELKSEGFFKKTKTLAEIRNRLAELGHNYPLTTLSGAMQGQAKKRKLRRFNQGGKYVYAQ